MTFSKYAMRFQHNEKLQNDEASVLKAVQEEGSLLLEANERFHNNKKIVMAALAAPNEDGGFFHCISDDLKKDREVVLAAVQQNGHVLGQVEKSFLQDKEVLLAALKSSGTALQFVPKELLNKEMAIAAVNSEVYSYVKLPEEFQKDKDVACEALRSCARDGDELSVFEDIHPSLQADPEVVLLALSLGGNPKYSRIPPEKWVKILATQQGTSPEKLVNAESAEHGGGLPSQEKATGVTPS